MNIHKSGSTDVILKVFAITEVYHFLLKTYVHNSVNFVLLIAISSTFWNIFASFHSNLDCFALLISDVFLKEYSLEGVVRQPKTKFGNEEF